MLIRVRLDQEVLVIDEPTDSQPAFTAFRRYFKRYCGNVYHLFLTNGRDNQNIVPISILINGEPVEGIDPLFMDEAKANGSLGNPEDWSGRTVQLGEEQGKDRGTAWITRLNEVRKVTAHPVKQLYRPTTLDDMSWI
jgi:hypothetical protein